MGTGLPRPSECRDCADPIRFVELESGKALPVNPLPSTEGKGNVAARQSGYRLVGFVITKDRLPGGFHPLRFTPHYATCPAQQRPPARAPEPPPPTLF